MDNKKSLENSRDFARAADGNRTRDLRTTNATLYRLSHSSLFCFGRSREPRIYYHGGQILSTVFLKKFKEIFGADFRAHKTVEKLYMDVIMSICAIYRKGLVGDG